MANLKLLYHGTNANFTPSDIQLLPNYAHTTGGALGTGLYTTPDMARAQQYGTNVLAIDYQLTNALSVTEIKLPQPTIRLLIAEINRKSDFVWDYLDPDQYTTPTAISILTDKLMASNQSDIGLINEIVNVCGDPELVASTLVALGYNHAFQTAHGQSEYVLYDLNQLRQSHFIN